MSHHKHTVNHERYHQIPTTKLLQWAVCRCHEWIISAFDHLGRCGECGEVPQRISVTDHPVLPGDRSRRVDHG